MRLSNLGQARLDADIQPTTLARPSDTVDLDANPWPMRLAWLAVGGLALYALTREDRPRVSSGPDALEVLRREGWR